MYKMYTHTLPSNYHINKIAKIACLFFKGDVLLKSRMDDAFMLKFLRARKFKVNKAFKLVSF